MPASKLNYLVAYRNDPQVFGSTSKEIALSSPPPEGSTLEDKRIWFISNEPDTGQIVKYEIPQDEILSAEIKEPKPKKKKEE